MFLSNPTANILISTSYIKVLTRLQTFSIKKGFFLVLSQRINVKYGLFVAIGSPFKKAEFIISKSKRKVSALILTDVKLNNASAIHRIF